MLLTFSFTFDASIFQLFQPLLRVLVCHSRGGAWGRSSADYPCVRRHRINLLGATPSWLSLLLREPEFEQCDSVRVVFCGGESLSSDIPEKIGAFGY
jgi:non-ribosomal peptide synthetase component F